MIHKSYNFLLIHKNIKTKVTIADTTDNNENINVNIALTACVRGLSVLSPKETHRFVMATHAMKINNIMNIFIYHTTLSAIDLAHSSRITTSLGTSRVVAPELLMTSSTILPDGA